MGAADLFVLETQSPRTRTDDQSVSSPEGQMAHGRVCRRRQRTEQMQQFECKNRNEMFRVRSPSERLMGRAGAASTQKRARQRVDFRQRLSFFRQFQQKLDPLMRTGKNMGITPGRCMRVEARDSGDVVPRRTKLIDEVNPMQRQKTGASSALEPPHTVGARGNAAGPLGKKDAEPVGFPDIVRPQNYRLI